jgi:hypothetical protein
MEQCANYADEDHKERGTERERESEGWWKNRFIRELNACMESSGVVLVREVTSVEGDSVVWIEMNKTRLGWIRFLDILCNNNILYKIIIIK